MTSGNLIKKYRDKLYLDPEELAHKANMDLSYLLLLEKDERNHPSFSAIKRLASVLGPEYILELFEINQEAPSLEYCIPINPSKEEIDKTNAALGTTFRTTEDHVEELLDKVVEAVEQCEQGTWYVGDCINVKVYLEYEPENK